MTCCHQSWDAEHRPYPDLQKLTKFIRIRCRSSRIRSVPLGPFAGKRKDETNETDDTEDLDSAEDENEDGQSSNTHKDQDSDVSFENDTEEEIDTTEFDEEYWIEYIKRSTNDAIEKMGNAKTRLTKK